MVDVPYLRKTLEHITANPKEWNQRHYGVRSEECGTAYCVAGLVASWEGFTFRWAEVDFTGKEVIHEAVDAEGETWRVETAAQKALGLSRDQGEALFHADNDLFQLWSLASVFTDGEIEIPEDVQVVES